jgi:hypothetical protein
MCDYCVDQWGKNTYDNQETRIYLLFIMISLKRLNCDQIKASLVVLRQEMHVQQRSHRV